MRGAYTVHFVAHYAVQMGFDYLMKMHRSKITQDVSDRHRPCETIFVIGRPYIIKTNIDVTDGLANGVVAILVHIEQNKQNEISQL